MDMPTQNKELIKRFYELFKNSDQAYRDLCHKDIEWTTLDGMPHGGRYVGVKAVFEGYFVKMLSNFKEFHANPDEFVGVEDKVIVFGRYYGESKSGKKFDVPFCHVYTVQDDKILRFKQFTDTKKIQESL
ncbi:nuclear transport factor 2 family protein [Candidatus Nitrosotenuis aquarius]|uniref:nuclear transport factor 2 family protein n=1 Tax=Candidatus Nitrosotenuis aquarius TaxID=1846278 RepID=UPI001FEAC24F|nr:nuclear transport factor 2 family protein [Candidatus Nitrosotenuis aquarius]